MLPLGESEHPQWRKYSPIQKLLADIIENGSLMMKSTQNMAVYKQLRIMPI